MIKEAIARIVVRSDLSEGEAEGVMGEIMRGEATPCQVAAFITALRMKGEIPAEIAGCARAMRASALKVTSRRQPLVDTCGTGGDGAGTFNISTVVALVLAGAGVAVAKHGNRSVSSRCGSADLLETLGVRIDLGPDEAGRCLDETGIAFLFAQRLHPAMKHAAAPRREVGIRTIFNILGPLANPAGATSQLMGVYAPELTGTMAEVLRALGSQEAMIVHGHGGLDELSTTGANRVARLSHGRIETYELDAASLGLPRATLIDLKGGSPQENAVIAMDLLRGRRSPARDVVLLNAAAGLIVAGRVAGMEAGILAAAESIDSGRALHKLEELVAVTQKLGGGKG